MPKTNLHQAGPHMVAVIFTMLQGGRAQWHDLIVNELHHTSCVATFFGAVCTAGIRYQIVADPIPCPVDHSADSPADVLAGTDKKPQSAAQGSGTQARMTASNEDGMSVCQVPVQTGITRGQH